MWWREYYPRSRPRRAKGGIKAQSKQGAFGQSWWAKRWIDVLESFDLGARLTRGRSYARGGQVLSIDIDCGEVKARVQGSQAKPYAITLQVKVLSADEWKQVLEALAQQTLYVAKLLAGEMPQEIEEVFRQVKLSLFPEKAKDLVTECSCPDWSNPCKHIAAVYYLLGEEFDRDPFLLFKLRGLSREELLEHLGQNSPASSVTETEAAAPEPLPAQASLFWSGSALPDDFFGDVQVAAQHAALPKRLGSFPFWRGQERFLEALEPIYRQASRRGLHVFEEGGAEHEQAITPG
jgi:uncharacterized Zn finger protein